MIGQGWTFARPTLFMMFLGLGALIAGVASKDIWLGGIGLYCFGYHSGSFACDRLVASRSKTTADQVIPQKHPE